MEDKLNGVTGQYIDDSLSRSTKYFMHVTDKILQTLEFRKTECYNTTFTEIRILTELFGFCLSQAQNSPNRWYG